MVVTKIMLLHKKKSKILELEQEERKIMAKLSLVKANNRSAKKENISLETGFKNKNRKEHPLSINKILEDNIISSAFPSICY